MCFIFSDISRENRQSTGGGSIASIGSSSVNSSINNQTSFSSNAGPARNQRADSKEFKNSHARERNDATDSSGNSNTTTTATSSSSSSRKSHRNSNIN